MFVSVNFFVPASPPELSSLILAICMIAMIWLPSITRKLVITILEPATLTWIGKALLCQQGRRA
jgi:hypothetical protein